MDDSLDIDDLFADDGALSLPQASISKGLIQKVDELRLLGCNQYVNGMIHWLPLSTLI